MNQIKQNSVDIEDDDSSYETESVTSSNNDIYEVCGYIGPTLVEDPKADTSPSYLDVKYKIFI